MKKNILFTAFIVLIFLNACSSEAPIPNTANVNSPNANTEIAENVNTNLIPLDNLKNGNVNANQVNVIVPKNANQKIQVNTVSAPFNSSITTTMTKDGKFLETRSFKNDPLVVKMERLQETKKIKVYLKNGKVVELPYEKGFVLFTNGSPQDILNAAGIKPPAAPQVVNPKKLEEATKDVIKKLPN